MTSRRFAVLTAVNALLCFLLILAALLVGASYDVRRDPYFASAYALLGAFWLAAALRWFPMLGISLRDDVMERRNRAAFWALNGALIGLAACYAGANIGNGPGPEAVLFCAVLGSGTFVLLWFLADLLALHWADAITVDRDYGSGLRFGAFLLATGFAIGSALTGDWMSYEATVRDFLVRSWPLLPVLAVAVSLQKRFRGSKRAGAPWAGAAVIVILASLCILVERSLR